MLKIKLPNYVEKALEMLCRSGFEAYVVGGAVRDALLGKEPTDWDITTDALPEDIKKTFPKHYETGVMHGTVTVVVDAAPIEVTTYRVDGKYTDARRPDSVRFTKRLYDDLLRRDFSINALAYNEVSKIVDIYGGIDDLKKGIIRCIGKPDERFQEDALRILRAVRFAATLGFQIHINTYESLCRNAQLLKYISGERICSEITKLLIVDSGHELLFDSGIGEIILPEVTCCFKVWQNNPRQIYDVGNHLLETVAAIPKSPVLRFAALFHDIGKARTRHTDHFGFDTFPNHAAVSANLAKPILERLKFSNKMKKSILDLIRWHEVKVRPTQLSVKRAAAKLGKVELGDLLTLKRANSMSHNPHLIHAELETLDKVEEIYADILARNAPLYIKDLAVTGGDLKHIGLNGSQIGNMLRYLMVRVIEDEGMNTKEKLLELAHNKMYSVN